MTIRDHLTKRKSRFVYWSIASFLALFISLIAGEALDSPPLLVLAMASLLSYLVSVAFYQYRVRCPRCGGNVGRHTNYFGVRKTLLYDTVNYCPFCGIHLDQPVEP